MDDAERPQRLAQGERRPVELAEHLVALEDLLARPPRVLVTEELTPAFATLIERGAVSAVLAASAAFVALLKVTGMALGTVLFLLVLVRYLGGHAWWMCAAVASWESART